MIAHCSAERFLKQLLPIERRAFSAIYQLGHDPQHTPIEYVSFYGSLQEIAWKAGLDEGVAVWAVLMLIRRRLLKTMRTSWQERLYRLNMPLDGPHEIKRLTVAGALSATHMVDEMLATGELGHLSGAQLKVLLTLARHAKLEYGRYVVRNKPAQFLYEESDIKRGIFYPAVRELMRKGVVKADRSPNEPSSYQLLRPRRRRPDASRG